MLWRPIKTMELLSHRNTQAMKGIAAIGIFVFHILLGYDVSPIFNMWGGVFVSVFLILSGYGLEESFRKNGLNGYWQKRLNKVVLPTCFFIFAYNYLYSCFSIDIDSSPGAVMHNCLDELLYIKPTFWFVFFITKCYAVYWIGSRFLTERLRFFFFFTCALACLNMKAPCGHLEAEQSFSFLAGVLISMNKHRVEILSDRKIKSGMFLLLSIGAALFCLKSIPLLHEFKGSIAYNYLLCPFRLSMGLAFIPLFTMFHPGRNMLLRTAGKFSLEIYIAHIPFIGLITDIASTSVFMAYSICSFLILLIYRNHIANKLGLAEVLFIIVNVIFVAKYSARIAESFALWSTLFAAVFYYILARLLIPYYLSGYKRNMMIVWGICLLALVGMVAMQYVIDPYTLQVDRWSALHFPIQNLLSGVYPYTASTHLGGNASPFPVWQILHIPFYFLGNVGLSFFVVLAIFLWSCWKVQGKETVAIVCLFLCTSVAVWYEVAVRSDLITNMMLVSSLINLSFRCLSQEWIVKRRAWIAVAVGLMASSRLIVLIPIGLLLLPYFVKMSWRKQIAVILLATSVFILTFLPFALWDWHEFFYFHNNPWALQTSQGSISVILFFVPIAILMAMTHNGKSVIYYRNSALMLVAFVSATYVYNMYSSENWDIFSSTYDITYFSTSLPFCLLAIGERG